MEIQRLINSFENIQEWEFLNDKKKENAEKMLKTREDELEKIREEFNQKER